MICHFSFVISTENEIRLPFLIGLKCTRTCVLRSKQEERRRAAARRAKPGFSKLLEAMGVQNQSEEDEDEDEDEDEEMEGDALAGPEIAPEVGFTWFYHALTMVLPGLWGKT